MRNMYYELFSLIDSQINKNQVDSVTDIPINSNVLGLLDNLVDLDNSSEFMSYEYFFRASDGKDENGELVTQKHQNLCMFNTLVLGLLDSLGVTFSNNFVTLDTDTAKIVGSKKVMVNNTINVLDTIMKCTLCHSDADNKEVFKENLIKALKATDESLIVTHNATELGEQIKVVYWLSKGYSLRDTATKTGLGIKKVMNRRDKYISMSKILMEEE